MKWIQDTQTMHHDIKRKWILDVVPIKTVASFLDYCLIALVGIGYELPIDRIEARIGFDEGHRIMKHGMRVEVPNNFGETIARITCRAAYERKYGGFLTEERLNQMVHHIQKMLRADGVKGYLREFFWFSHHRLRS